MAANLPQEKEWCPRSHMVGAFGTLTRAAAAKASLFTQYIDEVAEEQSLVEGRPEQHTTCVEVAYIKTRNTDTTASVTEVFNRQAREGVVGEAYFGLHVVKPGDGLYHTNFQTQVLINIGSTKNFVNGKKGMSAADKATLSKDVLQYQSYVYVNTAPKSLSDCVAELNKEKKNEIEILQSKEYALADGWAGVRRFLDAKEGTAIFRLEELSFPDADGMGAFDSAMATVMTQPHRMTSDPAYRKYGTPGGQPELTVPIAYTVKKDDKNMMLFILDDTDTLAGDAGITDESVGVGLSKIVPDQSKLYFMGPAAGSPVVKELVANGSGASFYAISASSVIA